MSRRLFVVSLAAALTAIAAAPVPGRSMLWVVRPADGPPSYLAGSVHALSKDYYPLGEAWEQAFAAASVLVEEVDLDEMDRPESALALLDKGVLADGRSLADLVPPALYRDVLDRAGKLGLPEAAIQRMKPWMAAMSLTTPELRQAGFDPALGVDRHFFERAKAAGKERRALETAEYQLDRLDQLSLPLQTSMLESAIEDLDTGADDLAAIAGAWAGGDTAALERLLLSSTRETPELYQRLLVERNRNWVAPVERCLAQRTSCFVVVGAAHLVGADSLVALLRARGYSVEQQ